MTTSILSPRLERQSNHFLVEATSFARNEGVSEIDLMVVPSPQSFGLNNNHYYAEDIETIAKRWQDHGLGTLRFRDHGIMIRPVFEFNPAGFAAAKRMHRRGTLRHRIARINWAAVSAIAAIIAAGAAAAAAYLSYLSLAVR